AASGGTNVGGAGSSYDIPSGGITLYAQWTAVVPGTDTVTFNSEGGAPVTSMNGPDGTTITLPGAPSYSGYTFDGWFVAPSGGTALTSPYTLSGSVTLYAQWTTSAVPTGGPPVVVVIQEAPFGAAVTTTGSAAFADTLATNGSGVTFKVTSPNTHLAVSSSGNVTTTGPLAVGAYSISGTDTDTAGGSGYWGFTLSVTATFTAVGGPPIVVKVAPEVILAAYTPWTLFAHQAVRLRVHLYGRRGTVSGVVKLEFRGQTLCTPKLIRGVGHCTVSSAKLGLGRHYLLVNYAGSGFYKPLKHRVNVFVHGTAVFP
ncbi:MAG: InlB B-repeat-containing protein, partial [Acidimicrobiales bacterium]